MNRLIHVELAGIHRLTSKGSNININLNPVDVPRMVDDVREDTIRDLLDENDAEDLKQMRREMQELIEDTSDEREEELVHYRLTIVEDAIERVEDVE